MLKTKLKRVTLHPLLEDGSMDTSVNLYPKTFIDGIVDREGNPVEVQEKLIAGENITIDENNVISATGGGSFDIPVYDFSGEEYPSQEILSAIFEKRDPIIKIITGEDDEDDKTYLDNLLCQLTSTVKGKIRINKEYREYEIIAYISFVPQAEIEKGGHSGSGNYHIDSDGGYNIQLLVAKIDGIDDYFCEISDASSNYVDRKDVEEMINEFWQNVAVPYIDEHGGGNPRLQQMTATVLIDALTNINGRFLSKFSYYESYRDKYRFLVLQYEYGRVSREKAADYMEYMTGSRFVPEFNYEKPQNSIFVFADGTIWKPQYDEDFGLSLWQLPNPFGTDIEYASNDDVDDIFDGGSTDEVTIYKNYTSVEEPGGEFKVERGSSFSEYLHPYKDYHFTNYSLTIGGTDYTSKYMSLDGKGNLFISIPSVLDDVTIYAYAQNGGSETYWNFNAVLENVDLSNYPETIANNSAYQTSITPYSNYYITRLDVYMDGINITYDSDKCSIMDYGSYRELTIYSVTGDVQITATAETSSISYSVRIHNDNKWYATNTQESVLENSSFETSIWGNAGYEIGFADVQILMGGGDITSWAWDPYTNTIRIDSVTNDIDIYAWPTLLPDWFTVEARGDSGWYLSSQVPAVYYGSSYETYVYTLSDQYTITGVNVYMSGNDISYCYDQINNRIYIEQVTGNIEIEVHTQDNIHYRIQPQEGYGVTWYLSNDSFEISSGGTYQSHLNFYDDNVLDRIEIWMNGNDITYESFSYGSNYIYIPEVVGNVTVFVYTRPRSGEHLINYSYDHGAVIQSERDGQYTIPDGNYFTTRVYIDTENYPGYYISNVQVTMGGHDMPSAFSPDIYSSTEGYINVSSVTGVLDINVETEVIY